MSSGLGRGAGLPAPFDLDRLDPEERGLWEELASDSPSDDGPAVLVWSFGYACMLELGRVPDVVGERLDELDPHDLVRRYVENVRAGGRRPRREP